MKKESYLLIGLVIIVLTLGLWYFEEMEKGKILKTLLENNELIASRKIEVLQNGLNEKNMVIKEFEKRKIKTVVKNVPAECLSCIGQFKYPYFVESKDKLVSYKTNDVFTEIGLFEIDFKTINEPYVEALKDCEKMALRKKKPFRWINEVYGDMGLALDGYEFEVGYSPLEFGSKRLLFKPKAKMRYEMSALNPEFGAGVFINVIFQR